MKVDRRRGVSPTIEALLTTAIALGAGAIFYGFYSGLLATSTQQPAVTIQTLNLSVGTSATVFGITVKNAGTTAFSSVLMTIIITGLPAVGTTTAPTVTSAGSITWAVTTPVATDTQYKFTVASGTLAQGSTTGFTASFSVPNLTAGSLYPVQVLIGSTTLATEVQAIQG